MSDPKAMLDQLSVPFPDHALKARQGGGNQSFTYVEAETVIRRLNAAVGSWDFRMTSHEWMAPIHYKNSKGDSKVSQTLIVFGELTIPGLGTRSGTGVQAIDPEARGAEDMIKGAMSDCLKKCATQFGVALELYGPDLEAGEIPANTPPRSRGTTSNTVRKPAPQQESGPAGWTQFWNAAREAGLPNKAAAEEAIGQLGNDPAYALERLAAWQFDTAKEQAVRS